MTCEAWPMVDGCFLATQSETRTESRSTHLVFDCIVIIQQDSTLIVLQWKYDWIDVVDIAMAVGIA